MVSEARDEKFIAADAMANDGYTNLPARLGEASPLQSSGEYTRSNITANYELLTVLYRENWIAKRIIDMPCEDMTRAWYSISTELEQSQIDKIKKVEAKHNVKGEITNALRWARLYGGSLALMVIKGQEDMLAEPLDYDMIMPGSFKGLLVLDKVTGISPSLELEEDMDDPDFGLPKYYEVVIDTTSSSFVRIHHSRVLRFIGRDLPPQEEIREDYWGASELEHIYEELQKRNATSANIAQLVFQANTRVLKMADYGEVIGMGTNKQKKEVLSAIEAQNRLLTSFGVQIMGTDDNMESHPYSFSGVSEVYESFMMDMAGAANIPATKLFGRSPQGMNATGESDMNNYYESIAQMQERSLRPALEKLLPVMCMSIFGAIPDDMEIVFEPIATTTPEQRANISGQFTGTIIDTFSAGLIGRKTALMELREMGKEIGAWTKISDETIEEADDEVDQGEMMGGGMPGEEGMMPPEGQAPVEEAPPELQGQVESPEQNQVPVEEGQEQIQVPVEKEEEDSSPDLMQELADDLDEIQKEHDKVGFIQRMVERLFSRRKGAKDGGVGSGIKGHRTPGSRFREKLREQQNQAHREAVTIPKAPKEEKRTKASVEKANREREEWANMTMGQRLKEANRTTYKPRGKAMRQAAKKLVTGHPKEAEQVMKKNKHLWIEGTNDGGEGSGNFNHAGIPGQQGGSQPSGGGSGSNSGHKHPTQDEIKDAAKKVIQGGYKKGIDKKGMARHGNKANAEKAAQEEYEKNMERYKRDIAKGKDVQEPAYHQKSYFDGVNGEFILRKSLEAIDKGVCKWYSKPGGEQKCQVTFNKDLGFTGQRGSDDMVPTRTVTVTFSRENGFHCYPDLKREGV